MKHMPAGAFSPVPMTISFSRFGQDFPAKRLRPEPGQAGQIASVSDDVAEPDSMMRPYMNDERREAIVVFVPLSRCDLRDLSRTERMSFC